MLVRSVSFKFIPTFNFLRGLRRKLDSATFQGNANAQENMANATKRSVGRGKIV